MHEWVCIYTVYRIFVYASANKYIFQCVRRFLSLKFIAVLVCFIVFFFLSVLNHKLSLISLLYTDFKRTEEDMPDPQQANLSPICLALNGAPHIVCGHFVHGRRVPSWAISGPVTRGGGGGVKNRKVILIDDSVDDCDTAVVTGESPPRPVAFRRM